MICHDFDSHLRTYLADWAQRNQAKYKEADDMEAAMPEVYARWLNLSAPWLDGEAPGFFFARHSDPEFLLEWVAEYLRQGVPVPDPLTARIAELGAASVQPLTQRLDASLPEEMQMIALSLLREIDQEQPIQAYLALIRSHGGQGEVSVAAAEALRAIGKEALAPCLAVMRDAPFALRLCLMEVAADFPGGDEVLEHMRYLLEEGQEVALCAAYAARLGDPRALRSLRAAAKAPELDYLAFTELAAAVEALGGEPLAEREFAGDAAYEALRNV